MSQKGFNIPSSNFTDVQSWSRTVVDSIISLRNGKTTNTDLVTLGANTTSTTVSLPPGRLGSDSFIGWDPQTSSGAAALHSGTFRVKTRDVENKQIILKHPSTADTDKILRYLIQG